MKILWLVSWYPSALHPFDGDFIQRHAQAAALFTEVEVLHVVKDSKGIETQTIKETVHVNEKLTERIIYYKPFKTSIQIVDRLLSHLQYKKICRAALKNYVVKQGKPPFIHVHIAMKAGLNALWLKRKYNVPYILTEHWGGYLPTAAPNINDYNFIYKYYWEKIITNAMASTYVSDFLKNHLMHVYKVDNCVLIPNVVNTDIFYPSPKLPYDKIRFVHVSIMTYQKNTEAILAAMALLKNDFAFELYLYGPINSSLQRLIIKLGLQHEVIVKGEVAQPILAKLIQQSDALILYSRFETFGCVIIEANACGVPVIVSDLTVFHEIVNEGVNGFFVEGENQIALAEKLKQFILQKNTFDKMAIASHAAEKYNYKKIGQQFADLYMKLYN